MDTITSTQNKRVRQVKALATKARLRRTERKLVLEGDRLIADALVRGGNPDIALYSPGRADYELIAKLQSRRCNLLPVSESVLRHVSDTQQSPGAVAVFHMPRPPIPDPCQRVLILDAIRVPGNLGAILRTASAAGIDIAILAPGCCDATNGKVLRAGMGAHFRLPIVEAAWNEIADFCQDMRVYAATADADISYDRADWSENWALILGNEAHGISREARKIAGSAIAIPMDGRTESLNVASAAAVILFEARRQRPQATLAGAPAVD